MTDCSKLNDHWQEVGAGAAMLGLFTCLFIAQCYKNVFSHAAGRICVCLGNIIRCPGEIN